MGELIYDTVDNSLRQLLNPELTASWEKGLTYVAQGEITEDEYMVKLDGFIRRRTANVMNLNNSRQLISLFDQVKPYYENTKPAARRASSGSSAGTKTSARNGSRSRAKSSSAATEKEQ